MAERRCGALLTCEQSGRCEEPATRTHDGAPVCWVHYYASLNPVRVEPLAFAPLLAPVAVGGAR